MERILVFDFLDKPIREIDNNYFEITIKSNKFKPIFGQKDYEIFLSNKIEYLIRLSADSTYPIEENIKFPIEASYTNIEALYFILSQILSNQSLKEQFKHNIEAAIKHEKHAREILFEMQPIRWELLRKTPYYAILHCIENRKIRFKLLKDVATSDPTGKMISDIGLNEYSFIVSPEEVYNPDWGVKKV